MPHPAFVHHVFFWLKNEGSPDDREKLLEGLRTLTGIPVIRSWHIGLPASTARQVIDSTYAVSWLCIFDDLAAQEVYQDHPLHLAFIAQCAPLWERVVVYDAVDTP